MMEAALTALMLTSLFLLGRQALILSGVYKDPVLRISERYAQQDDTYYPLPWILLWFGLLVFSGGLLLVYVVHLRIPVYLVGIVLMIVSYAAFVHPELALRFPQILLAYPRWYALLRENTTREERRRIAYMWLWLPRRMRLYYNSDRVAFSIWSDLIILSTISYTVEDKETQQRFLERS